MKPGPASGVAAVVLALSLLPGPAAATSGDGGGIRQMGTLHAAPHGRGGAHSQAAASALVSPAPALSPGAVPGVAVAVTRTAPAPAAAGAMLTSGAPLLLPLARPLVLAPTQVAPPAPASIPVTEPGAATGTAPEELQPPRDKRPPKLAPEEPALVEIRAAALPGFVIPLLAVLLGGLLLLGVVLFLRQRKQRAELQVLERGKLDFLLLASHELRTPMSVLAGYLSMAEDGSLGLLPAAATEALPDMELKMGEMNAKLEQILLAVSASYGRLNPELRAIDAVELLAGAIEKAVENGHPGERFRILGNQRALVVCDPEYTALTLSSLIDNAAKFSPATEPVICSVKRPRFRSRVEFTITDRGPGVPREVREILFSRFGRLAGPLNSHLSGAGLGLFLAREMARAQGGDVVLRKTSEQGSEFILRLPAA